jgi:hypothetical protein
LSKVISPNRKSFGQFFYARKFLKVKKMLQLTNHKSLAIGLQKFLGDAYLISKNFGIDGFIIPDIYIKVSN